VSVSFTLSRLHGGNLIAVPLATATAKKVNQEKSFD